jgi:hypothetical protein
MEARLCEQRCGLGTARMLALLGRTFRRLTSRVAAMMIWPPTEATTMYELQARHVQANMG